MGRAAGITCCCAGGATYEDAARSTVRGCRAPLSRTRVCLIATNFNWQYTLDENGKQFASRIETPDFTEHDVLTGSQLDGTAFPPGEDRTCSNWTSNGEGSAHVGHADRYSFSTPGSPWNSSHGTPGCSQEALVSVGGAGLLYCFAID